MEVNAEIYTWLAKANMIEAEIRKYTNRAR